MSEFIADKGVPYAPAFPLGQCSPHYGMSLRAYIAAKALEGFCANPTYTGVFAGELADRAVEMADVLIRRLNNA